MVSFFRDAFTQWWLDWYAPALSLSYHPFGGNSFLDPFLQAGIGSAGRVMLARRPPASPSRALPLLFPPPRRVFPSPCMARAIPYL